MSWLQRLLSNHVLTNLSFGLVLVLGYLAYQQLPPARDPEINFNWVNVITILPGASAEDIERRITDPLEDAIASGVSDIKFVTSTSREAISNILIRFNQIDERTFDKRLSDLRREVQNTYNDELPSEAEDPIIYEITSSSGFPAATVVVTGVGADENLRVQARNVRKDLERLKGVDKITPMGLDDPELHVSFFPERLVGLGITPADLSDTVRAYFRDVSGGDIDTSEGQWLVRLAGTSANPEVMANYSVITAQGVVALGALAELSRSTEEPSELVFYQGEPAVMLPIVKKANTNVIELVERVQAYIDQRNALSENTGVRLTLVDDQTISTKEALALMQNNALIGLLLVLLVTWVFLGNRISFLTSIGIPFTLAGTFLFLNIIGMSLNNMVLLGVVIALGMLVDDAVVVVETMYRKLQNGVEGIAAAIEALREVFAPVTTSVLTTMAAFLPLMLLPGILGEFMKVIPLVVTIALAISLIEAYWMLPAHVSASGKYAKAATKTWRDRMTHKVKLRYTRWLLKALRHPIISITCSGAIFILAILILAFGLIRFNFFETDPLRLFYVNVQTDSGTSLEENGRIIREIETQMLEVIEPDELRATLAYAGQQMTETEPLFGNNVGQVMVSLNPAQHGFRSVDEVADAVQERLQKVEGIKSLSLLRMNNGPPTTRAVSVKVRGDDFAIIKKAADRLSQFMQSQGNYSNITLDYRAGNPELVLRLNADAIKRAGLNPNTVSRVMQAYVDGEIVTDFQDRGEEVKVRVVAKQDKRAGIDALLRQTLSLPQGGAVALGDLVIPKYGLGQHNIRHYNFRRTITLEADIDKEAINTVQANQLIEDEWRRISGEFPNINLDFTGELDDIQESLDAIWMLALLGVGLIYIILGTQFRSYWQPLMVLTSLPLAITGVILGLFVTNNPLSLYTLYGVVALMGISVNSAIVLISAANERLTSGMSLLHATVYAARRRVIPILITSLTTIAGLFSLAAGLAGKSLIWGPVATAIVSGLVVSTLLTLFVIPLIFRTFMGFSVAHLWQRALRLFRKPALRPNNNNWPD